MFGSLKNSLIFVLYTGETLLPSAMPSRASNKLLPPVLFISSFFSTAENFTCGLVLATAPIIICFRWGRFPLPAAIPKSIVILSITPFPPFSRTLPKVSSPFFASSYNSSALKPSPSANNAVAENKAFSVPCFSFSSLVVSLPVMPRLRPRAPVAVPIPENSIPVPKPDIPEV